MRKRDIGCIAALVTGIVIFAGTRLADDIFLFGVARDLSGYIWVGFLIIMIAALFFKRRRIASAAFMVMLLAIGTLITSFPAPKQAPEGEPVEQVRLYQHNTLFRNPVYDETAEMMAASAYDSDIVFLQEVRPELLEATEALTAARFPHRIINEGEHYPMALFSRFPIIEHAFVPHKAGGRIYIDALLELPGGTELRFIGMHLASPGKPENMRIRDFQLKDLRETLFVDNDRPAILAGDINATMFHPQLRALYKENDMSGARSSYAWRGTWPSFLPEPLRVTIDHAFGINGVFINERQVGDPAGSDHLPLYHVFDIYPADSLSK